MFPISEKELKSTNHPIYAKRVKSMQDSEEKLLVAFERISDWSSANIEDQRTFLQLCHKSESVAIIIINKKAFPTEPNFLFKRDLYFDARKKLCPVKFDVRIADVENNDTDIYFRKAKTINRSSWYRSEPRGEVGMLCSLFGYKEFGYIDPDETEERWFKHLYGMLPYNRIKKVTLEKTEINFFESNFFIVHIETNKKK